jgi:hypothetical protein
MHTGRLGTLIGFGIQVCAGGAGLIWPESKWIGWTIFAIGSATVAISLAIWFLGNYRLRSPFSRRVEDAPQALTAPRSADPSAQNRRYISDFDRDRIAEALHQLSNLLNDEIVPMGHKAGQLASRWDGQRSDIEMMERLVAELEVLRTNADTAEQKIFREIYPMYQDYSQELHDIMHTNRGDQPLKKVSDAAFKMMKAVKTYVHATKTAPSTQAGVQVLVGYPYQNLLDASHKLNGWSGECRQRIDAKRKDLSR